MIKQFLLTLFFVSYAGSSYAMEIKSNDMQEGSPMDQSFSFGGFGCSGANISPQLSWEGAPEGTKGYAITAYDPDAPTESGFWHWVVINIPTTIESLDRGASGNLSIGEELSNDYGMNVYGGPCPPKGHGMHRYQFTIWALPTEKLEIPEAASNAVVGYMLNATAIDKARLTATYVSE